METTIRIVREVGCGWVVILDSLNGKPQGGGWGRVLGEDFTSRRAALAWWNSNRARIEAQS